MKKFIDHNLDVLKESKKIALKMDSNQITYSELYTLTIRFSCYMARNKIGKNSRVILIAPKSLESIIAILSIIRIGACYIPLDESIPEKRLEYIVAEINPDAIVVPKNISQNYQALLSGHQLFILDDYKELMKDSYLPDANDLSKFESLNNSRSVKDLIYIIFTSGTTGNPKGVMIRHEGVSNYISQIVELAEYEQSSVFLCVAPLHFDAHIIGLYSMLSVGGTLVLKNKIIFPNSLTKALRNFHITDTVLVSSVLRLLNSKYANLKSGSLPSLKTIMYGAESCSIEVLADIKEKIPQVHFIHGYGPTEATCGVLYHRFHEIPEKTTGYMPLGKPLKNVDVYALRDDNTLIDQGEEGELYIGGLQLMSGYFNDPVGTSNALVMKKEFSNNLLLKTRDIMSIDQEGLYYFIGRKDDMVKIGGNLVHPSEIKRCILKLNNDAIDIRDVIISVKNDDFFNNKLICFIITKDKDLFCRDEIKKHMNRFLPPYMIPEEIYVKNIEEVPYKSSGKIDKTKLLA